MSDPDFPLTPDEDLPRTFRRARRERDAAQRDAGAGDPAQLAASHGAAQTAAMSAAEPLSGPQPAPFEHGPGTQKPHVVVREFKVSFFHLMFFFIKAVFAAIPALIILGGLLWLGGEYLTTSYPELLKMKILIQFPN